MTPTPLLQLEGRVFLSEAGLETDLIFHHGIDLPDFASFPLLESPDGRATLTRYYQSFVDLAQRDRTGVVLETPTWRANSDWGARLGYNPTRLDEVNQDAVSFMKDLRNTNPDVPFVISGNIGPRGDGYQISDAMTAAEATIYHLPQIQSFAAAGADLTTALTLNYSAEAIGIATAAADTGIPSVISFTVETNGALPSGQPLADAIDQVDKATDAAAAYFMVNCAHPTHFLHVLQGQGPWHRLRGVRANASVMSHHELDNATELDRGNETDLADGYARLVELLPGIAVVGGCCGTDIRHIDAISAALAH